MPTRKLSFSENHRVTKLAPANEPVHIEVSAGESEYQIFQDGAIVESNEYVFHLRHPGSQVFILGIVNSAGETTPRLRTSVIHHAPSTKAETVVRTLSNDTAFPHYEGVIIIEEGANGSESYLNHHSLLLGSTAKSWTLPSLEIKADDVRCSHAATMRTITDFDLFYLRSRGLDETNARELLVEAFLTGK